MKFATYLHDARDVLFTMGSCVLNVTNAYDGVTDESCVKCQNQNLSTWEEAYLKHSSLLIPVLKEGTPITITRKLTYRYVIGSSQFSGATYFYIFSRLTADITSQVMLCFGAGDNPPHTYLCQFRNGQNFIINEDLGFTHTQGVYKTLKVGFTIALSREGYVKISPVFQLDSVTVELPIFELPETALSNLYDYPQLALGIHTSTGYLSDFSVLVTGVE